MIDNTSVLFFIVFAATITFVLGLVTYFVKKPEKYGR